MKRRQERLERLRAVDREYTAAVLAVECLQDRLRVDPAALARRGLRPKDVENLDENLAATYFVRLFAEFEAALRDVWAKGFGKKTEPPTRQLIDAVAGRCGVPDPDVDEVHRVRVHRNAIVHEGVEVTDPVPFPEARSALGKFLARLPADW